MRAPPIRGRDEAGAGGSIPQAPTTSLIFASVASLGWRVPLHLGYFAQPRKYPRRLGRTTIGPPHCSQVSSTAIDLRSGPLAAAAGACSASCALSSSGTCAVPRHLG